MWKLGKCINTLLIFFVKSAKKFAVLPSFNRVSLITHFHLKKIWFRDIKLSTNLWLWMHTLPFKEIGDSEALSHKIKWSLSISIVALFCRMDQSQERKIESKWNANWSERKSKLLTNRHLKTRSLRAINS